MHARLAPLLMALVLAGPARGGPAPGGAAARVDPADRESVDQLASDDPQARKDAADRLLRRGRDARAALVEALGHEHPQVRLAAGQILLRLPFDAPDDPPAVRGFLQAYGRQDVAARAAGLRAVIDAGGAAAPGILLRLVAEEPSDEVRWAIVGHFRKTLAGRGAARPGAAAFEAAAASDRSPNVALLGWARETASPPDLAGARRAYRRCMAIEQEQATADGGEAEFVYTALLRGALRDRQYDTAAYVLRARHARRPGTTQEDDGRTDALEELFVLHARAGPLAGFADDVSTFQAELGRPELAYAAGMTYQARGGQRLLADAFYRGAYLSSLGSGPARDAVGEFLANHSFNDLARQELQTILAAEPRNTAAHTNAHLRLGLVLARLGDDEGAADHKTQAMEALRAIGGVLTRTRGDRKFTGKEAEDTMWAEIHWHAFRAAQKKNNAADADRHLESLLALAPDDEHLVLDVLPVLVERGRQEDARRLAARPYGALRAKADASPDDPEPLNNLAWLCARGNVRLDEARAAIDKALALRPDHFAYLDTAAEVYFRLGQFDKAIELEKRAIAGRPDDEFLVTQLKRFEDARKKSPKP